MADIKKLLRRNRFSLEILGIVALAQLIAMQVLHQLTPQDSRMPKDFWEAISLLLISAPLIFWRSRAVHGRETQSMSKALQSSSHAVLMLDKQGCIYWVNEGFTRMSGYTLEESMGATPKDLLDSGLTPAAASELLWNSLARAEPCRAEVCNRRKDGQIYWGDIDLRPDFDRHDRLVGYIEICTDITELKESKLQLKASLLEAEALRHTVDTHAIVSVADRAGLIIEANDAFCAISGYSREQLLGSNHRILNSGAHAAEFWTAMWGNIAQGKPWRGEICNRNSRGDLYWVDSMIAPFLGIDGHVEKYVSIRMDITERKLLELLLSDAQERVRLATESAGIGIWSLNLRNGVQTWDAQQYRLFGLSAEADSAAPISDLWSRHLHLQDADGAQAGFQQSLADGVPFVRQFRIIRPDGAVRHIKALGSPRLDANGLVEYIVGTNQDVTDAVMLAESLQDARLRAEEASEVKSQFMANMSHEIRTPMNAVLGLLQLLDHTVLDARQHAYVTQAERASRLMLRMIDSVLDYSRLEADRMGLQCDPFCVDEWLDELAVMLSDSVGDKDINVLFDVPLPLPEYLVGDRKRLRQVLVCLLDNAIKFTASGEVVCRIALLQQTASNCRLDFCVSDTGIGIAPEFLSTIFADFVQLQAGNTRTYSGVGLGLPVAQRLVHLMGGKMGVQSEPGQGSSFSFTLDLATPMSRLAPPQRTVLPQWPDAAALVVDACPSARELIAKKAQSLLGYADVANTCQQALDMARRRLDQDERPYTLILLDWNMPDADSGQTLQQLLTLYKDRHHAQPNVIMLSNNSNHAQHAQLVKRDGLANGFLAKPFTESMLHKALLRTPVALHATVVEPVRTQRLQGMRVLVVEDNPINQRVMQEMLVFEGAVVTLAANGLQGVDAIRASQARQGFDVVLMDLQMPVMDGYQAAREIRNGLLLEDLPIIAVSANVQASDRAESLDAGMNFHIGKPYVLDDLVAVMLHLTGRAPAAQSTVVSDASPDAQPRQGAALSSLPVYWIRSLAQESPPDLEGLLQQGLVLHPLDSVAALAARMADAAGMAALVVADRATVTSAAMRDLRAKNGASMKAMALLVLADAVTEDDMQACLRAGAVDVVSMPYARNHLGVLARKHINAQGELRVDPNNPVVAVDAHSAMARIQSDPPFFGSLLRAFFDELPLRQKLLHDDWSHDPAQIKHRSHALKGLAVSLGLESLAEVARQAEALVPHPGKALDAALLLQLEAEMQSARFQILRWLGLQQASDALSP